MSYVIRIGGIGLEFLLRVCFVFPTDGKSIHLKLLFPENLSSADLIKNNRKISISVENWLVHEMYEVSVNETSLS